MGSLRGTVYRRQTLALCMISCNTVWLSASRSPQGWHQGIKRSANYSSQLDIALSDLQMTCRMQYRAASALSSGATTASMQSSHCGLALRFGGVPMARSDPRMHFLLSSLLRALLP